MFVNTTNTQDTRAPADSVLAAPSGTDPAWRETIETAVRARESAAELRRKAPANFTIPVVRYLG